MENAMATVLGLKCIFDTNASSWAVELALDGEPSTHRFVVSSAEDVEQIVESFEESTETTFDPESGEIAFSFEYAFGKEDMDEEEDDEEDEGEEETSSRKKS
jgi:hypothetical protein